MSVLNEDLRVISNELECRLVSIRDLLGLDNRQSKEVRLRLMEALDDYLEIRAIESLQKKELDYESLEYPLWA